MITQWESLVGRAVFKKTLKREMAKFLTTLPDAEDHEWYCTDHEVGKKVLRAFFWSVAPELKPKDLPSWEEWPLERRSLSRVTHRRC